MGLSTAERNRRKRERKKREREEQHQQRSEAEKGKSLSSEEPIDVVIEYVLESPTVATTGAVPDIVDVMKRFQARAASVAGMVSDDENQDVTTLDSKKQGRHYDDDDDGEENGDDARPVSKRKLREKIRPTVDQLKREVVRPDLVEAHDITATDPQFLIQLKAIPGTVPVPRHWGRKRKYLQGKRGFEKPPFQLPDFLVKTGIAEIRDTIALEESKMSIRQKNRARVAPKMGAVDVDYRTLHDAFFKYQTKPANLTKFGDLYYEGKEIEVNINIQPGGPLSDKLREALGMTADNAPPPWLINMQRYGPPPSYPNLKVPGLNAPLPSPDCLYGYHPGGWGKPPVDAYGRPLYGGNPFDPPGTGTKKESNEITLVTNDGKMLQKRPWGSLPMGALDEGESEEEASESEMDESSQSEQEEEEADNDLVRGDGTDSVMPPPPTITTAPSELRKQAGEETPMVASASAPKQLYQVIEQKQAGSAQGSNVVFASEIAYALPTAAPAPEGAASVLAKAAPSNEALKRKRNDDDDGTDLNKNFKF